jgi:hypothetical protein
MISRQSIKDDSGVCDSCFQVGNIKRDRSPAKIPGGHLVHIIEYHSYTYYLNSFNPVGKWGDLRTNRTITPDRSKKVTYITNVHCAATRLLNVCLRPRPPVVEALHFFRAGHLIFFQLTCGLLPSQNSLAQLGYVEVNIFHEFTCAEELLTHCTKVWTQRRPSERKLSFPLVKPAATKSCRKSFKIRSLQILRMPITITFTVGPGSQRSFVTCPHFLPILSSNCLP